MRAKDMFLENNKHLFKLIIFILFLFPFNAYSEINYKKKVLEYLNTLEFFSASFIQNDGIDISEGKVFIGKDRIRAEYLLPNKILIILDQDKAMYYNYDLDEDEFFDPKNTNAWFFYDVFRNPYFFQDSFLKNLNSEIILEKEGFDSDLGKYLVKVYFEIKPLVLRKIEVVVDDNFVELSIYNHKFNEEFNSDFFKLIHPKFLN